MRSAKLLSLVVSVVVALLCFTPARAGAQVSIGVGGQFLSLSGDDFEGTDAGFGGEAKVMFSAGKVVKLGGGVQYSSHNQDNLAASVKILGLIAEGRYMFATASGKATPYVAGRGGWVQGRVSDPDFDGDGTPDANKLTSSGFAFGAGGGVLVSLSSSTSLDLGAVFHSVSLGDIDADGTTIPNSDSNGTVFQFRVGVSFMVGGAAR
ncbi:MAG: outer membrane beta-barrel protein [Gemmatimonadales bacterium]